MSSGLNVKIVSAPNLEKLESFFKDASYRELIEYCVNFNTRLCLERRLRLPFLDPQTGVAQNHCQLFVDKRQRMPGFRQGQIYTYPSARWRKSRRQYLSKMCRFPDRPFQALTKDHEAMMATAAQSMATGKSSPVVIIGSGGGGGVNTTIAGGILNDSDLNATLMEESSSLGGAGGDTSDSKDSQQQQQQQQQQQHHHHQQLKDNHLPKDWFYDDMDINDNDSLEEPKSPADDEYDYDPRYGSKKRRKRKSGKKSQLGALGDGCGGNSGNASGTGSGRRGRGAGAGAGRGRGSGASISNASIPLSSSSPLAVIDSSLSGIDSLDGLSSSDVSSTPTVSQRPGRRPRGGSTGRRGRRRTKTTATTTTTTGGGSNPHNANLNSEPPSFESVAATVGSIDGDLTGIGVNMGEDHNGDLRNYRKYV